MNIHEIAAVFVSYVLQSGLLLTVGLIAPRPFLVESATYDCIFPIKATELSIERAKAVYAVFGARDQVEVDFFEGRHEISGRRSYGFLTKKLRSERC